MGSFEWIVIAGSFIVSVSLACFVILKAMARQNQARTESLQEALQQLNLQYTTEIGAEKSELLDSVLSIRNLQTQKKLSLASGVFHDQNIDLLTLEEMVYTGNAAVAVRQSVCLIPLNRSVPEMTLTPWNIFHAIAYMFGSGSVSFPTHPDFSKKYLVKGEHPDLIEDFMTPQILEFFEERPKILWDVTKNTLLYFRPAKELTSLEEIEEFLNHGTLLASHLNKS